MGGGGGNGTQTVRTEPWHPTQEMFTGTLLPALQQAYDSNLWDRMGDFNPSRATEMGQQATMRAGRRAEGFLGGAMDAQSSFMDGGEQYRRLGAVRREALGNALPSVFASFDGAGMGDSSLMADAAGRAAVQAIAPIEYGAWNAAQDRALKASALAPSTAMAGAIPGQFFGQVGAARDAERAANRPAAGQFRDLMGYSGLLGGVGGMGGMQTGPGPQGASLGSSIAGAGLTGLGTYGTLAAAGVGAPWLLPLAIGAGGLSLLGNL